MKVLCILLWITRIFTEIECSDSLNEKLQEYFSSEIVQTCNELWAKHKISVEKAVEKVLNEYTGSKILNVHLKNLNETVPVTDGIMIRDGAVDLLLEDLRIRHLPRFIFVQVFLDVPSHVLRIEAALTRLHLDARYELTKNESTYKSSENGPLSSSPFSVQEVAPEGQVAIYADHCQYLSLSVVKLNLEYVNLGFGTPKLTECKFSVEIFKPGSQSPPVFAPYFSQSEADMLTDLLAVPIQEKLQPLIQGTLVSYINTTAIFGEHLTKFREAQESIFALTSDYMEKSATELNKLSAKSLTKPRLAFFKTLSNSASGHSRPINKGITLDEITLHGLDSVYSAHSGGPYKLDNIRIGEALRFSSLQVRGNLQYSVGTDAFKNSFISTIKDFAVHLTLNQDGKSARRTFVFGSPYLNYISGFSQILAEHRDPLKDYTQHLLSAHILNTMPEGLNVLSRALNTVFGQQLDDGDMEANDDQDNYQEADDDDAADDLEADDDEEANGPESASAVESAADDTGNDDIVAADDVESADDIEAANDVESADDIVAANDVESADDIVAANDVESADNIVAANGVESADDVASLTV